jgi:hypothetical protein
MQKGVYIYEQIRILKLLKTKHAYRINFYTSFFLLS